jgi:copper transport protein
MLCYTARAALAWRADPVAMRRLVGLYSRAAGWLFALTVLTGLTSALVLVPIDSLLTTGYGRVLIIKAALVAVAAGLAVRGRRWLLRGTAAQPRAAAQPGAAAQPAGLPLATRLEAAALIVVLAVTGLLTALTPPRHTSLIPANSPSGHSGRPTVHIRAGQQMVRIR